MEWYEEVEAEARLAAVQAEATFDPSQGVPFAAYLYMRVMGSAIARYRREWSQGLRLSSESVLEAGGGLVEEESSIFMKIDLSWALERLAAADRWLIQCLYFEGKSGAEVALGLGITQQAVSKRKVQVLQRLRQILSSYS